MNHIYRLCWNQTLAQPVPAPEFARRAHGGTARRNLARGVLSLTLLAASLGCALGAPAATAPTGGQIVGGTGQIQQSGDTTTIRQQSQVLSLNWQGFDVGAAQTVNFLQPGAGSIAVNRILGNTASGIYGHLNANGQVWLINPNGVLFGKTARVQVGGLVASTLDLDGPAGSGSVRFAGTGSGSVTNYGSIVAANGGYVALLGNTVSNQGLISAQLGTVALAAGTAMTLTFNSSHLLHLEVNANTVQSLVENHQLLVANGGQVLMTAGARDSLIASAVNNSGVVEARTVEDHDGTITLLGGMQAGSVEVGGTLDAGAPNGGDGGRIETSAAHVAVASGADVSAAAPAGKAGTWTVDPVDLTIDNAAATTISNTLQGGTNVTEQTTATGASGPGTQAPGNGDINVDAAIDWTSAATLELDAYHNINVNAPVTGSGGIVMNAPSGTLTIASAGGLSAGAGAVLAAGKFVNQASASALGPDWLLYTASPANDTLGGLTPDFIQYDATQSSTLAASGNGLIYSAAPTLRVNGLEGTLSKTYDGTNAANNFTGANFNAAGLLAGDTIAAATGGSYASVNVGSGIAVTSPAAITDFSIVNNGVPVYGYALSGSPVTAAIGTITRRPLTAQIVGNPTKVYDGTTTATLDASNYEIDGFVAGQGATVGQPSSIAYAGSSAGPQQLNATFTVTNFTATSGTQLSNYTLPTTATGAGTITPAPLLIGGLLADNKVYDGTTSDTIDASGASLFGVIQPDAGQVALATSGITGSFAQANVGNGIAVSVSGYALTGAKAADYQLVAPAGLTASITPKTLTIDQLTAANKTYDATTAATLDTSAATLAGVVGADQVSLDSGAATGTFSQAAVGNDLSVTTSGFTLGGSAAGNYSLTQPIVSASITPALLTVTMAGTPTKTYDGTAAVTLGSSNFNVAGFIGSQSAVVSQSSASYASANAGRGIDVTATLQPSDFTPAAGTSLSNYTFAPTVTGSGLGVINPAPLTGLIVNNPTKVYDGNTDAALAASNLELVGVLPGQSISASFSGTVPGTYASANAGAWGVTAGTLAATYFTAGAGTLLSNYALPTGPNSYTGSGTIEPAPLSGQVISASIINASKVYDGTPDITLSGANFTLSGFVGSDSATVNPNDAIAGTFGQSDVGTGIPLSATLTMGELVPSGSTNLNNYSLQNPALGVGNITPKALTVLVTGNPTKVYDGSTEAALTSSNFTIKGWAAGEGGSIDPSATASYATADAGGNIDITATLVPGNYALDANTKASNYTFAFSATGPGTITQAPLFVTGVYATNKVYDTTTTDTLSTAKAGLAGLVDSDTGTVSLDLANVVANFSQANVGNNLGVTASGFAITGSQAANYALQPVTGLTADITPATLTLSGVLAENKTYDGNRSDTLNASNAQLNGVLGSDAVGFDAGGATGEFSTQNAGTGLAVSASGFTLTGAAAGNYQLSQPGGLTADIAPQPLTAVITGSPTKPYDGTDSATLTAADYELQGFVGSEGASIPQSATANYVTANAGTGLGVVSTLVTSDFRADPGTLLSNYVLPTSGAGSNGVITPLVLNLTGTRVYDTTTTADAALFGTLQGIKGQTLDVTGSGTLVSKDVGTQLAFASMGSLALANGSDGGLAQNYTLAGGTDWVTITPAPLTADFTADDKVYDGTRTATLAAPATLVGVLGSDSVTLDSPTSALFASKNVGTWTVTGAMSVSGTDAGNYTFTQGTASASITPLHITVTATGANKQYDATVADPGASVGSAGIIAGDKVDFGYGAADFADKNVGNGITVTVTGVTTSGADAGDYIVDNAASVTTTADITPRILNLAATRIYDGTTDAPADLFAPGGSLATGFGGETLVLAGAGSTADKNVGTDKAVALGTLALADGGNGGVASNYTLAGGTDQLTITPRPLTATFDADNKVYDGTTAATLVNAAMVDANGSTTSGLIAGDSVALTNPTVGNFSDKNVGNGKTVTGDMGITGADAGNYAFTNGTALADITKANLTVTATGSDKTYDGNTTAAVTLHGGFAGDNLIFTDTSAEYDGKNAGAHSIAVDGISVGGSDAGNYNLVNTTATTTGTIDPVVLNLAGTRVYDGTVDADADVFGGGGVLDGVNGETVDLSGSGSVADKDAGTDKPLTSLGSLTLADGSNGGLAQNYTLTGGTDTLTVTPRTIDVAATADDKVYDTTTGATVASLGSTGILAGDAVTFGYGAANFADANVGTGKTVTVTGITDSGADAGNYALANTTATATASITPYVLNLAGTRVYDAATDAGASAFGSNGVLAGLAGQTLDLSGTGSVVDKNVGTNKPLASLGTLLLGDGGNGGLARNYTLSGGTDTLTITPRSIDVSATANDKVYDTSTGATLASLGSTGVLAGDAVGFGYGAANFADANAGTGKTVTVSGITDSGADAGNYVLANTTATTTASITPYVLDLAGTRVYDATTDANSNLFGSQGVLTGLAGQTLNLSGAGSVGDKNVGHDKPLASLGTLALADGTGNAGNYTLAGGTDTLTITPRTIGVAATADDKVYDTTTSATLASLGSTGILPGDAVTFGYGAANFADANAGTGKTVAVTGISDSGADAGNYALANTTAITTASITPYVLNLAGTRAYDATSHANSNAFGANGVLAGLSGQTLELSGAGQAGDGNVGRDTPLTSLGTLALADGGNGGLAQNYTLLGGSDTLTITPYVLDLSGTRVYDATTRADANLFGSNGVLTGLAGQTLKLSGTGNVADKNVGHDKPLATLGTLALADGSGSAGNYTLIGGNDTLTITPLAVTVDATGTNKIFDDNTVDPVRLGSTGVLAGDTLSFTYRLANFADPDIGNGKPVQVTGIGLSGPDAANYTVVDPDTSTVADITGGQPSAFGIPGGALAHVDRVAIGPTLIATPYGLAPQVTVGPFSGNHKKPRHPIERNTSRADFVSGMDLTVIDGGVRLPVGPSR